MPNDYPYYNNFEKISEDFTPYLHKNLLHFRVKGLADFKARCQKALDEFCDELHFDDIPDVGYSGEADKGLTCSDTERYEPHMDDEMTAQFCFKGGLFGYITAYWLKDNEGNRFVTELSAFLPA